jgi:hypothetical protein
VRAEVRGLIAEVKNGIGEVRLPDSRMKRNPDRTSASQLKAQILLDLWPCHCRFVQAIASVFQVDAVFDDFRELKI